MFIVIERCKEKMELVVLLVLIVLVIVLLKDIKWVTYLLGIIEIFLRIVHYIGDHLKIAELNNFINGYLPNSLFSVLSKYSSGIVYDILSWILLGFFIFFLCYLVRYLLKRK